jgi:hypothetical protein
MFDTVLLAWFVTQMLAPSNAIPVGFEPTAISLAVLIGAASGFTSVVAVPA